MPRVPTSQGFTLEICSSVEAPLLFFKSRSPFFMLKYWRLYNSRIDNHLEKKSASQKSSYISMVGNRP